MSLTAACGWTLLRSLLVALLALPVCWWLHKYLASAPRRTRAALWTLLFIPFFTPALLTGYAFANFWLSLVRYPAWNEALYATLIGLRLVPVGTLLLYFAPPGPVSAEAYHCAQLVVPQAGPRWSRLRFLTPFALRTSLRNLAPTFAVIFLLAFQEFETASMMGIASWTVWLFDAQAGGLMLPETLGRSVLPASCELVVLILLFAFAARSQFLTAAPRRADRRLPFGLQITLWCFAAAAVGLTFGIPVALVGRDTLEGLSTVLRDGRLLTEILTAAGFGLVSGSVAALLAALILKALLNRRSSRTARVLAWCGVVFSLVGLTGALVVSLGILWLFQQPGFRAIYNTPIPAVVALVIFLLPRALVLQLLFQAATPQVESHLARLLAAAPDARRRTMASELLWSLVRRRHVLAAGVLCVWGYLELTPVAILAPPGLTTAPVRLYNLMHYGRSAVHSAMTMLTMLAPIAFFLLAAVARRIVRTVITIAQQT